MPKKGTKWTEKRKRLWSEQCKSTGCNNFNKSWTDAQRKEISVRSKKTNAAYWTEEKRKEHSEKMKAIVKQYPDSYSKNNVSGRVKMYEVESARGLTKVKGTWELKVANWLNENSISWTNDFEPIPYKWKNKWHLYFPDFYLIEHDVIIEVKGFKTQRDEAKWKALKDKIFVVINDMNNIDEILSQGTINGRWRGS